MNGTIGGGLNRAATVREWTIGDRRESGERSLTVAARENPSIDARRNVRASLAVVYRPPPLIRPFLGKDEWGRDTATETVLIDFADRVTERLDHVHECADVERACARFGDSTGIQKGRVDLTARERDGDGAFYVA